MGHHPVVEMSHPLHIRKGHQGTLDADEKVHDGAGENELGADVGMNLTQLAFGRVPDVDQEGHHRDHHGHAVHDGHDLEPGGHRHLQQMVGTDVGIDHDQRPEPQQGQGVAVQGAAGGPRDDVVGRGRRERRQQQAKNIVPVEPEQNGVGNPHQGPAVRPPDHVAQGKGAGRQNSAGQHVPDRYIQHRLGALFHRHDEVDEDQHKGRHHGHIDGPDQFGVFAALGEPHGQGDHQADQGQIPGSHGEKSQFLAVETGSQQAREEIKGRPQQTGGHESKEDQIDVGGPYPSEDNAADIPEQVRGHQLGGTQPAVKRGHHHPESGCQAEPLGRSIFHMRVSSR